VVVFPQPLPLRSQMKEIPSAVIYEDVTAIGSFCNIRG
jgi:hypothetical protein